MAKACLSSLLHTCIGPTPQLLVPMHVTVRLVIIFNRI